MACSVIVSALVLGVLPAVRSLLGTHNLMCLRFTVVIGVRLPGDGVGTRFR
jgi:hypothetical protein